MMTSASNEADSVFTISSDVLTYDSRFTQDFILVRLIGRGAYGRVFEANKKIDGKHYAVKRIKLPANKEAREKVMREVIALADLNHRNIVRYYHAWREDPPKGWQDDQDATTLAHLASSLDGNSSLISEDFLSTTMGTTCDEGRNSFASIFGELKPQLLRKSSSSSWAKDLATPQNTLIPGRFDRYLYIQMELCRRETLAKWLEERMPEQDIYQMYHDILKAVEYLHSKKLIHRDLKPSNIFFALDGTVKVGDLGLVKDMVTSRQSESQLSNPAFDHDGMKQVELTGEMQHTQQIGTSLYMSPEQKEYKPYNHKVDVYALAIVLFELLVPFGTVSERIDVIQRLREFTFPITFRPLYGLSAELLLTSMLSVDPDVRPEVKDILLDPWISSRGSPHKNGVSANNTRKNSREQKEKYYKLLVIGDQNTGKTSIIHRYVHDEFRQLSQSTIGAGINLKKLTWPDDTETCQLTLEFFDIGGEERTRFMTSAFYRKAVGAFVVMDVTQPNGFQAATLWKKDLDTKLRMHDDSFVPSVLLINKCDAGRTNELNPTQVDRFCRQNKFAGWFDTSAKDDINIGEAVQFLVGKILALEATLPPSENKEPKGHRLDENLSLVPVNSTKKKCSLA